MTAPGDQLLAPYHSVRRVTAGPEAPWPGVIVRIDAGDTAVMIDAEHLGSGWAGWSADSDGHLLAPLDVVRTPDGHAVLTSLCTTRLRDFLARRAARGYLLSDGEMVTLAVSIARGLREAAAIGAESGEWWLTDAGRPVLVTEATDAPIAASTGELLPALRSASDAAPSWAWLDAWPTSPRDLVALEARAFEIATPSALGEAPATTVTPWPLDDRPARVVDTSDAITLEEREPSLLERVGRQLDLDIADLVSRSLTGVWRRLRRPGGVSRRRLAAVSAAVGVAVVAVGLLWPADGQGAPMPTRHPVVDAVTAPPDPAIRESAIPSPSNSPEGVEETLDVAAVVSELLARRTACDGDAACLGDVVVRPGADFPHGVIDAQSTDRRVTLVDDYGGVAVVRVDPVTDTGEQPLLVVVQRTDEKWLLRDVYVTQQP